MKRPSSGNTKFGFQKVLIPAVRRLRRFECQGVDDSCRNFTYIPANRSPDTIKNIYYNSYLVKVRQVCCGGYAVGL